MVRYYRFRPVAPLDTDENIPQASSVMCYGEFDGIFACRLFVVQSGGVAVAPYDMAFIEAQGMREPPAGDHIYDLSFREFEELWEELAQRRLHMLARSGVAPLPSAQALYVKQPFPEQFKHAEPSSDLYTEWANGVARRHFEVFPDRVVVATHDAEAGWPKHFEAEVQAIELGLDGDRPIDPLMRPVALTHAALEEAWEQHALPRLHELAGLRRHAGD